MPLNKETNTSNVEQMAKIALDLNFQYESGQRKYGPLILSMPKLHSAESCQKS